MSRTNAAGDVCDPSGYAYPDFMLTDQELLDKVRRNISATEKMAKSMGCPPPTFTMGHDMAKRLLTLAERGMPKGDVIDVEPQKEITHDA